MPNGIDVGAKVTPEFNAKIEEIHERRDEDNSKAQTVRHLMREGAYQYDQPGFIQSFFKYAALGLAVMALVAFSYGTAVGYPRPAVLGAWIMVPALISLALYDAWPGLSKRFNSDTKTSSTGA